MERQKLERFINSFITGKCEDVLKEFPENSIDLIVTSPPYADQRFYGTDESRIHPDDYVEWFLPKAIEFKRVLKETGSFILNINDKVVEGKQHLYVFELVLKLVKEIGFNFVRDYIWFNPSTPPNIFSTGKYGRTKKSHEYCFWFSKGDTWTFNLDPIRKPYSHDMLKFLQGRGKGDRKYNSRPSTHSFDCEKVWPDNGGSDPGSVIKLDYIDYIDDPGSVIEIGNTSSNDSFIKMCKAKGIAHPARFPEKLVEFFILSGSNENDIVLDPFCGSGTTAVSAHRHKRRWIGIDANKDYCELAYDRMKLEFPDEYEQMRLI
jgi:DNA modification methylase